MRIQLITPAPLRINNGNKITALRWAAILRGLGHKITVDSEYPDRPCDLLIALHARRSFESIRQFREQHPAAPLIVALTGTDLYRDIKSDRNAQLSLEMASRIVVLQKMALRELPKRFHANTRVIYQSAEPYVATRPRRQGIFKISVIGHLRQEKDPLRTALASRLLPQTSRIEVVHVGESLDRQLAQRARAESRRNPRYRWIGPLPHWKTRRVLAASRLTVISSYMEGSSNVLSEALVSSVPVIASKIPGLMGTLGKDYPGYFRVADTRGLARMLCKAETDRDFYRQLKQHGRQLSQLVRPRREIAHWQKLLGEFH